MRSYKHPFYSRYVEHVMGTFVLVAVFVFYFGIPVFAQESSNDNTARSGTSENEEQKDLTARKKMEEAIRAAREKAKKAREGAKTEAIPQPAPSITIEEKAAPQPQEVKEAAQPEPSVKAEEQAAQKAQTEQIARAEAEKQAKEKAAAEELKAIAKKKAEEEAKAQAAAEKAKNEAEAVSKKKADQEKRVAAQKARDEERARKEAKQTVSKERTEDKAAALKKVREEEKTKKAAEASAKKKTEEDRKAALKKAAEDKEARKKAEKAAKAAAADEKLKKQKEIKADKYVKVAEKELAKKGYSDARGMTLKAQKENPANPKIPKLAENIDRGQIYTARLTEEKIREQEMKIASKEAKKDVVKENKGGKSWVEILKGAFRDRKYELGAVRVNRVYTVDECIETALARSLRYQVTDKQIKLAEIRVFEAYRELLPVLTGRYEVSSGRIGANGQVRHYRGEKYKVEIKQMLFDGMEKWFALRQAEANLDIVKLEKAKVENEIVEEVKKAYYSLDKAQKSVVIQEKNREKVKHYFDIIESLSKDNFVPRTEYLKLKSQIAQADFNCMSSTEDVKMAEMILFQAMNVEPEERIEIKPVEAPKETLTIGLDNCYQLALANEPDLRIKAKVVEYNNFERKMKKARGWPKVEFNGSFGASYENYQPLNDPTDIISDGSGPERAGRQIEPEWYAGVKTDIPVFGSTLEHNYVKEQWAPTVSAFRGTQSATNYFALKFLDNLSYFSDLQEAIVGFDRATYEYDKAKQDVMQKVKEMYFQYRKSLIQMDLSKVHLEYQDNYVAILNEQWKFGGMEASRVVEEIVKLGENEYGLTESTTSYYMSITGLNKAIGLPGYFKPDYENAEFKEWNDKRISEKAESDKAKQESKKKPTKQKSKNAPVEKKETKDIQTDVAENIAQAAGLDKNPLAGIDDGTEEK